MDAEVDAAVLRANVARVQARIAAAAARAGRNPADVTLVAVSKTQPVEVILAAYAAGLRLFGENRVEEAGPKAAEVQARLAPAPPPVWHMIGHVQSRKAADVLPQRARASGGQRSWRPGWRSVEKGWSCPCCWRSTWPAKRASTASTSADWPAQRSHRAGVPACASRG